ncbi:hypothetical protein TNCV_4469961 [Trichonephila clavipes]|nr:hypothetical protein TNCV_4469961 [Trichonephila clavipes]
MLPGSLISIALSIGSTCLDNVHGCKIALHYTTTHKDSLLPNPLIYVTYDGEKRAPVDESLRITFAVYIDISLDEHHPVLMMFTAERISGSPISCISCWTQIREHTDCTPGVKGQSLQDKCSLFACKFFFQTHRSRTS